MEASALPASVGLARSRIALGASLLRLRSDEQLVTLFREGNEDAFRVIHDRYRARLLAYARQMLSASGQDSEDALQEIFVRAYYGLRTNRRDLALRPWLYRVAHNRCVDELRRHIAMPVDPARAPTAEPLDPAVRAEQRDALRRLIADVQRLPEQQRSALLMRELSGMSYSEVAGALQVSVPAVKSLLVRARVGLAQASEARDTACAEIRQDLILAHDRGVRATGLTRRHLRDCPHCRQFRSEVRGVSRHLAALTPTLGPIGVIAKLLGIGGGSGAAASSSMAGGGAAAGSAAAAGGATATGAGLLAGSAGHVVTLLAAAVVTAGGAVEIQHTLVAPPSHHVAHASTVSRGTGAGVALDPADAPAGTTMAVTANRAEATSGTAAPAGGPGATDTASGSSTTAGGAAASSRHQGNAVAITQRLDPDQLMYNNPNLTNPGSSSMATGPGASSGQTGSPAAGGAATGSAANPSTSNPATAGTGTPGSGGAGSSTGASTAAGSTGTGSAPSSAGSPTPAAPGSQPSGSASTSVGTTVNVGAATSGRVVKFVSAKRHLNHHGFALGTLAP